MNEGKVNKREFVADVPKNGASVIRVFRRMAGRRELLELQVYAVPAVDAPAPKGKAQDGFLPVAGLELTADRETWERFARQVLNMRPGAKGARP
jgi:hypothetical protein